MPYWILNESGKRSHYAGRTEQSARLSAAGWAAQFQRDVVAENDEDNSRVTVSYTEIWFIDDMTKKDFKRHVKSGRTFHVASHTTVVSSRTQTGGMWVALVEVVNGKVVKVVR